MKDGDIIERGRHEELRKEEVSMRTFYNSQFEDVSKLIFVRIRKTGTHDCIIPILITDFIDSEFNLDNRSNLS